MEFETVTKSTGGKKNPQEDSRGQACASFMATQFMDTIHVMLSSKLATSPEKGDWGHWMALHYSS